MRERRLEHIFFRICECTGYLVVARLFLKVIFRKFLTGGGVYGMNPYELVRRGVEAHPLIVIVAMHAAVDSREQHVELGVHLCLGLIVALHIIVAAALCE